MNDKDLDLANPDFEEWAQQAASDRAQSLKKDEKDQFIKDEQAQHVQVQSHEDGSAELVEETDLLKAIAEHAGFEYRSLKNHQYKDKKVLSYVPAQVARTYNIMPLEVSSEGTLLIAISDPLNVHLLDDLHLFINMPLKALVAPEQDIKDLIEVHYRMGDETLDKIINEMDFEKEVDLSSENEFQIGNVEDMASSPTVIKLVDLMLLQAIKDRASDLHIEPSEEKIRIRYRVDGLLRELPPPPKHLHAGIISRIKIMSSMDISETRKPQDGRIRLNVSGKEVDLRVATLPTVRGEGVAMRILDKSVMNMGLEQVGMSAEILEEFDKIIHRPNGIVLVTGPTGCGKTTTLYAGFARVNNPEDKLISTEDPVEYELPGVVQVNVNAKVGLTFASCLRAILRQDPDKIMVGEIRDFETAQMAVQASLTGHLVFSTLHTNSAAATVTRLVDMGVEPFLITSSLQCVVGQRLIRTVCPLCRELYVPTDEELAQFGVSRKDVEGMEFYHGMGCDDCAHTGYKGRLGLFELLVLNEELQELVLDHASSDQLHSSAIRHGMQTMRQDGWGKIVAGITTFEEVILHTPSDEIEDDKVEFEEVLQQAEEKFKKEPITIPSADSMNAGEEAIQAIKVGDSEKAT